jgi:biotin carboxyl carrier protein
MPGVILDIQTQVGANVKEGDVLLILEAMKMENEIMAPCDGVVSQISVTKGASVDTGDVLVVL